MNQEELGRIATIRNGDVDKYVFPFDIHQVLSTVWDRVTPGMKFGSGHRKSFKAICRIQVLGVDFSSEMLAKVGAQIPQVELVQADLTLDEWPPALNRRFDRIVSNYVFHEFRLETRDILLAKDESLLVTLLFQLQICRPTYGKMSFIGRLAGALETAGWKLENIQVSFCAGFILEPPIAYIVEFL